MTHEALADSSGVAPTYMAKINTGVTNTSPDCIRARVEALKINLSFNSVSPYSNYDCAKCNS